jgi:hypothetical protein
LNAVAELNVEPRSLTHATFQVPMGWLNLDAYQNILARVETLATFQAPTG